MAASHDELKKEDNRDPSVILCEKISRLIYKIRDDLATVFGPENKYWPPIETAGKALEEKLRTIIPDKIRFEPEGEALALENFKAALNDPASPLVRALKAAPKSGKYSSKLFTGQFTNPYVQFQKAFPDFFIKNQKCIVS